MIIKMILLHMIKKEIINYWLNSSDADLQVIDTLYKNGHNVWALFIGHLVIEKLLKAYYVKHIDDQVPYTHDLSKIAKKANLCLSNEQEDFLDEVTTFNIKTRYPDYKNRFSQRASKEFTESYISKIKEFRLWIIQKINS